VRFHADGVELVKSCATATLIDELKIAFARIDLRAGSRSFGVSTSEHHLFGMEGCFRKACLALGLDGARPVRILAFDKSPQSNWGLGWHQDRVVALKERADTLGFENWTIKSGVHHVQAPLAILQHMFSLRLHIDDCPKENGALRIIPRSHRAGKISEPDIAHYVASENELICEASTGDILAMKALTLHASSASLIPSHRRVLHVDFCIAELPYPLQWAYEVTH
jgi:Phytanoyl-CoA dioxygenase (PhyH)